MVFSLEELTLSGSAVALEEWSDSIDEWAAQRHVEKVLGRCEFLAVDPDRENVLIKPVGSKKEYRLRHHS